MARGEGDPRARAVRLCVSARASGGGEKAVVGAGGGSWHTVGLTSLCLQEASACVAVVRNEKMYHAETGMQVARVLLLLGLGLLAFPSGATAQACTAGSKAVVIYDSCAILVSKRPPLG